MSRFSLSRVLGMDTSPDAAALLQRAVDLFRPAAAALRPAVLRLATGIYAAAHHGRRRAMFQRLHRQDAGQFAPVGVVRILRRPLPPVVADRLFDAAQVVNAAATLGLAHRVTGPLNAALQLWTLTYRNSWTMILHNDNMLVAHQMILGCTRSADALSVDSLVRHGTLAPGGLDRSYGAVAPAMNVATAAVYLISGAAKVRGPLGLGWARGEVLRGQIAIDGLRKELFGSSKPEAGTALYRQERLFTLLASVSLLVELGAPLALLDRRLGQLFSLAAWGMHAGIRVVMGIKFPYNLSGIAYLPFFPTGRQLPSIG